MVISMVIIFSKYRVPQAGNTRASKNADLWLDDLFRSCVTLGTRT